MSPSDPSQHESTMTGQRWSVRVVSLAYYFVIGPFLYDLFANGTRWRSAYLFPYILLSVSGLQIGFKESDRWVKIWYWVNLIFVSIVTIFAFFYAPFGVIASFYPWEKWVHFGILFVCIAFFPLHFFLKRTTMENPNQDWDEHLEEEDRKLPPKPIPAPAPIPAPTPAPIPPLKAAPPTVSTPPAAPESPAPTASDLEESHGDGGFLGH